MILDRSGRGMHFENLRRRRWILRHGRPIPQQSLQGFGRIGDLEITAPRIHNYVVLRTKYYIVVLRLSVDPTENVSMLTRNNKEQKHLIKMLTTRLSYNLPWT